MQKIFGDVCILHVYYIENEVKDVSFFYGFFESFVQFITQPWRKSSTLFIPVTKIFSRNQLKHCFSSTNSKMHEIEELKNVA